MDETISTQQEIGRRKRRASQVQHQEPSFPRTMPPRRFGNNFRHDVASRVPNTGQGDSGHPIGTPTWNIQERADIVSLT
jgi:hypothetical protein